VVRAREPIFEWADLSSYSERERICEAKPDILLTNFMMLELLMTRQDGLDRAVIANAHGLEYLVLGELHTYRGRQGADVAMLVRRVRDRLCPTKAPVCIGTSATMATEGDDAKRAADIAAVASRLFGTPISKLPEQHLWPPCFPCASQAALFGKHEVAKLLRMLATPAGMPRSPRFKDLDLQTFLTRIIQRKGLLREVTNLTVSSSAAFIVI
jgi:hypothetical protein